MQAPSFQLPGMGAFNPAANFDFSSQFEPSGANPLAGFTPGGGAPNFGSAIQAQGPSFTPGAGTDLSAFITGQNPALQGQINALDAAINQNLRSNLGAISGQATLAGQTGGSRQGFASGLAAQEASRQFSAGASDLIAQDFAQRTALADNLAAQQAAQDLALQQLGFAADQARADFGLRQDALRLGAAEAQAQVGLQQSAQQLQSLVAQGDFQTAGDQLRLAANQMGLDAAQIGAQLGLSAEQLRLAGIEVGGQQALEGARVGLAGEQLRTGRELEGAQLELGGRELQANILQALAGLQQQGLAQAGQLSLGGADAQRMAALGGLGELGNLFNLGMSPFAAQLAPLQALAQIIGSPTVLQQDRRFATQRQRSTGTMDSFTLGAPAGLFS